MIRRGEFNTAPKLRTLDFVLNYLLTLSKGSTPRASAYDHIYSKIYETSLTQRAQVARPVASSDFELVSAPIGTRPLLLW